MSTSMLSTCCGALPVAGIVRDYKEMANGVIARVGTCSACGSHVLFAPDGVLETSPKWLRLPPLYPLPKPEFRAVGNGLGLYTSEGAARLCSVDQKQQLMLVTARLAVNDRWLVALACAALAGWLAFVLLGTWSALHRGGEGEGSQGAFKGSLQEQVGGSHAPQPATKGQGGKQ